MTLEGWCCSVMVSKVVVGEDGWCLYSGQLLDWDPVLLMESLGFVDH